MTLYQIETDARLLCLVGVMRMCDNQEGANMELFDLHCDTIVCLGDKNEDFLTSTNQFSLRNRAELGRMCQTMAIFIPDDVRGEAAKNYFEKYYKYLLALDRKQRDLVELAYSAKDIRRINEDGKCALLLAVESGAALGGELEQVDYLAECGVKMMTLVWNGENELASGHNTDKGFTEFGRQVVKRMEEKQILVDVSHLNDRGFDELCEFAEKPFIATHSNLRSVCSHRRNLTEAQFQEMVRRKGLVGLNLFLNFLSDDSKGTVDVLFRHVYRMLELGGENVIACGSDFDGADIDPALDTPEKFAKAAEYFSQQGISDPIIKKIFYDNAIGFMERHGI